METIRVLVVKDEAIIALLLGELLAGMGHEVCATVETEHEAVIAAADCKRDLMIVDAGLSQGSGISAVEAILRTRAIAHVFISGDAERVRLRQPDAVVGVDPVKPDRK